MEASEDKLDLGAYERYLTSRGFSQNTLRSYLWVAAHFTQTYGEPTAQSLAAYREHLAATFKPGTANQRVQAINCWLRFLGKERLRLRSVCVRQTTFLDGALDGDAYRRLTRYLEGNGHLRDLHAVRLMATTGMRVSELLELEVDDLRRGWRDVRSKGKLRRVYVPDGVRGDALSWLGGLGRDSGRVFLNRYGAPITAGGLARQLKARAAECGVDESLVHPHAFRHLYARSFLAAGGDVVLLSDLMGHSSVETTRVYLRRTACEQRDEVNRLVTW